MSRRVFLSLLLYLESMILLAATMEQGQDESFKCKEQKLAFNLGVVTCTWQQNRGIIPTEQEKAVVCSEARAWAHRRSEQRPGV